MGSTMSTVAIAVSSERERAARRTIVITGASSGIGRELALLAGRLGFDVVAVARRTERLIDLAAQIRSEGGACIAVVADVRDKDAPARIVAETLSAFGRIDVLVNNAGTGAPGTLLEQTDDALDGQWDLHVGAPLRLSRAALPHLEKTRGQILFFGSGLARVPAAQFGAYCAAKAAVRAAATQLRRELRSRGIAVTYVDPGAVDTEFSQASGMQRSKGAWLVPPERVARRVMRAIRTRQAVLNAVPLQTLGVALGEMFPRLADIILAHVADTPAPPAAAGTQPQPQPPPPSPPRAAPSSLDEALAPVARRMERVKMPASFVRELLVPGAALDLAEVSMRWAGMPNKNERAATAEVLDALTAAGFLEKTGPESWRATRQPLD